MHVKLIDKKIEKLWKNELQRRDYEQRKCVEKKEENNKLTSLGHPLNYAPCIVRIAKIMIAKKSTDVNMTLFCLFVFGKRFCCCPSIGCTYTRWTSPRVFFLYRQLDLVLHFHLSFFVLFGFSLSVFFFWISCAFYVEQDEQKLQTLLCDNFELFEKKEIQQKLRYTSLAC